MNERIKELLNVCGMPNEDLMEIYSDPNKSFYIQQFAELIIRECIDLLNPEGDPYTSLREDYGRSLSMNMIKKHFGVKE